MGVFAVLRALEFCRRVVTGDQYARQQANLTDRLLPEVERVLAQEAWRRWAMGSYQDSLHPNAGNLVPLWQLVMEAIVRQRWGAAQVSTTSRSHSEVRANRILVGSGGI
jgi:hypothetical protein